MLIVSHLYFHHITFHLQKSESLSARAAKGAASNSKVQSSISAIIHAMRGEAGDARPTHRHLFKIGDSQHRWSSRIIKLAIVGISHPSGRTFKSFSIDQQSYYSGGTRMTEHANLSQVKVLTFVRQSVNLCSDAPQ
jgi:hypothetical protein